MQLDPTSDEAFRNFLPGGNQEDDRNLIVEFFVGKKLMGKRSQDAGREIYEDREYVKIMIKGQDKQIVVEEVRPHHKKKFPIAYHHFVTNKPVPIIGTPVEQMPGVGPSMAHSMKAINIRTIEDLAGITDENTIQRIGAGGRDLINRAKAWVQQKAPEAVGLRDELERERAARAEAERKAAEEKEAFEARIAALEELASKPRRRARAAA